MAFNLNSIQLSIVLVEAKYKKTAQYGIHIKHFNGLFCASSLDNSTLKPHLPSTAHAKERIHQ